MLNNSSPSRPTELDDLDREWRTLQLRAFCRAAAIEFRAKKLPTATKIALANDAKPAPRVSIYLAAAGCMVFMGAVLFVGWMITGFESWSEIVRGLTQ